MGSISLLLIPVVGWRMTYYIIAGYGMGIGVISILFLREPKRGQFDIKNDDADNFLIQLENESQADMQLAEALDK